MPEDASAHASADQSARRSADEPVYALLGGGSVRASQRPLPRTAVTTEGAEWNIYDRIDGVRRHPDVGSIPCLLFFLLHRINFFHLVP